MRFTVQLAERRLPALMRGKSDFIDVQVKDRKCTFLVYDVGVMVGYSVVPVTLEDYEDCFFRVPAKIFLSFLADAELVEFVVSEYGVVFTFRQRKGSGHYRFEVKKQVVNFEKFEQLKVVGERLASGKYRKMDVAPLAGFVRMAHFVGGVVSSDGSVFYCATNNVQLYQETEFPPSCSLSIYAKDLYMMTRYTEFLWNIGSTVVAQFDDFLIVVDKVRQKMSSDYGFLVGKKSKRQFDGDLSGALAAVKKLNYGAAAAIVNFTAGSCTLEMDGCDLTVPISVSAQAMPVRSDGSLDDLFKQLEERPKEVKVALTKEQIGLLYGFKQSMTFHVFKTFVKVELSNGMFLVISRSD